MKDEKRTFSEENIPGRQKPGLEEIETELKRVNRNARFRKLLRSTLYTLIVVAACAVLVAVLFMPVLRIYGASMNPTLNEGEIVVSVKGSSYETGDVIGVYFGSKLLIKRVIAAAGQWVDIDEDGNVYVYSDERGDPIDESAYLAPEQKSLGDCNITLPYQVPENAVFVMGDNRATSLDSRRSEIGCIDKENVVGKIIFRVWPLNRMGTID